MKNTDAEMEAVDEGVQNALKNNYWQAARYHRREARYLLRGKSGMDKSEQIERMKKAAEHLEKAIAAAEKENEA